MAELGAEDLKRVDELNTAVESSDKLVFKVAQLMVILLIIGTALEQLQGIACRMVIILGFLLAVAQNFYASKIHRLGVYLKCKGSDWENTRRSPLVGFFGTLLLIAPAFL